MFSIDRNPPNSFAGRFKEKNKNEVLNTFGRKVPRQLTYEQKQLILGTVIANGHIFQKKNLRYAALLVKHFLKEEKWLDCKYETLKEFVRTIPTRQVSFVHGKRCSCKSFKTLSHDYFSYLQKELYYRDIGDKYRKHLNKNILYKVDALGLSVIYMDIGRIKHKCRDFNFDSYSKEEQEIFCEYLKNKFGLKSRVIKYKTRWITRVYSWEKFDEIVSPFLIENMIYKIKNKKRDLEKVLGIEK